jgi:hypothetical protein
MSRPWRIEYEGALYHLLSRGNERSDIFRNDKDRDSFLDAVGEMSLPHQRQVAKSIDSKSYLRKGEQIFGCDLQHFVHSKRLSGAEKAIRDLLIYGIYKTGQLKNEKIASLFGLSYSGVSHAVKSAKIKLPKSRQLQTKFDQLNSLFKL